MSEFDELRKKFPARFSNLGFLCPPADSLPQTKRAYRLCKSVDTLEPADFCPTYLERHYDPNSETSYAVSFLEDIDTVTKYKNKWRSLENKRPVAGVIKKKYGFAKQKTNDPHCNLWLYEDATPWVDFEMNEM